MAILPPLTEKALGRKVVVVLDTPPAATTGIPTRTEVNAALFAALHMYTPFNVTPTQNTGEGPRKLGSKVAPQQNGLVTYPAVEVQSSYNPQEAGADGGEGNELYDVFKAAAVAGDRLTIAVFDGLDGNLSAIPTSAVGDVYLVEPGVIRKGQTGDGEFDEFSFTVSLVISGGEPIVVDHIFAT